MFSSKQKTVIVLAGPTAVGKTAAAIQLAKQFNTVIISADSRQCYHELRIGVARPSEEELAAVPHYFIASHSITEEVTAASFAAWSLALTEELFREHDVVVLTGGTGLYIRAFCEGLDPVPAVMPGIREKITADYTANGLDWLQEEIRRKDPLFAAQGEMQNPQRILRALEVLESTGKSVLSFHSGEKTARPFAIQKYALELPREQLIRNIETRVDQMMAAGLLEEVKQLIPYRHLNALQTVGYTELFDYLDGKITLEEAVEQIKIHTRQYAKRQMTWFRKDKEFVWRKPDEDIVES